MVFSGELGIDSLRRGRVSVPLHNSLFTVSPHPFGRFFRLLREAERLPYSQTNFQFTVLFIHHGKPDALPRAQLPGEVRAAGVGDNLLQIGDGAVGHQAFLAEFAAVGQ